MGARSGPAVQAQHAPCEATIRRAPVLKREEERRGGADGEEAAAR